jgi:hypothetical protein
MGKRMGFYLNLPVLPFFCYYFGITTRGEHYGSFYGLNGVLCFYHTFLSVLSLLCTHTAEVSKEKATPILYHRIERASYEMAYATPFFAFENSSTLDTLCSLDYNVDMQMQVSKCTILSRDGIKSNEKSYFVGSLWTRLYIGNYRAFPY